MGFADNLRDGIALINALTPDLQVTIRHWSWTGQNGMGTDTFSPVLSAPGVPRQAFVDQTRKFRQTAGGNYIMTIASIGFPVPVAPNGASGRTEPIDNRDVIQLPDGSTGPAIKAGGFLDSSTGRPFYDEVLLGEVGDRT